MTDPKTTLQVGFKYSSGYRVYVLILFIFLRIYDNNTLIYFFVTCIYIYIIYIDINPKTIIKHYAQEFVDNFHRKVSYAQVDVSTFRPSIVNALLLALDQEEAKEYGPEELLMKDCTLCDGEHDFFCKVSIIVIDIKGFG